MTSGDPTPLGMINDSLMSIANDQKKIVSSVAAIDKTQAVDSKRLDHIEGDVKYLKAGQKKIKESLWSHVNSKKVHYNQGYTETFSQRTWRRKDLIALLTGIFTAISWIILQYGG